jgi:predicted polyphosphate/ATP-dependent NAD kinase
LSCRVCYSPGPDTTATDTRRAVTAMVEAGADLILFAGGDGTARDVAAASGGVPILGIPAGVKMYSGVFANSALLAGRLASQFLETAPASRRCAEADLLDIDEESVRRDVPATRLFGTAKIPDSTMVQRAKASLPVDDDGQLLALCRDLAWRIEPNCLYIVGPGRTTRSFLAACGLPKTLLGIDVMRDGAIVAADANEADILRLLETCPGRIVVGLLGGQGCLFGRGNQQISSRVLRRVGRDRILVLAGAAKLASLPNGLFVDTGDTEIDRMLSGFIRVETAPGRTALLRVR